MPSCHYVTSIEIFKCNVQYYRAAMHEESTQPFFLSLSSQAYKINYESEIILQNCTNNIWSPALWSTSVCLFVCLSVCFFFSALCVLQWSQDYKSWEGSHNYFRFYYIPSNSLNLISLIMQTENSRGLYKTPDGNIIFWYSNLYISYTFSPSIPRGA